MNPNKNNSRDVNDEVEELLRAAEDAALLKLSINSHNVHASPSDLHPNLEQRFRDLKTGSKVKAKQEKMIRKMPPPEPAKENKEVEEDDLLARFAALKASMNPSPVGSSSIMGVGTVDTSVEDKLADGCSGGKSRIDDDEEEEEDEVEKVIRWAMDAARLDLSPDSDDEDYTKDDDIENSETSDAEDAESPQRNPKGKHKL